MQLPLLEVGLLESLLSVSVKLVEFVFEEFCHDSETGPVKEKVKLLVVLLLVGLRQLNFGLLGALLFLI